MSYPGPAPCTGCPRTSVTNIGPVPLCRECADFAGAMGEDGVNVLMRTSPRQRELILAGRLTAADLRIVPASSPPPAVSAPTGDLATDWAFGL